MKNNFHVYIATTIDDKLYTGIAIDPIKRINTHNSGKGSKCLRGQLPVTLTWMSDPMTKSSALKEEARIKKLSREHKYVFLLNEFVKTIRRSKVVQKTEGE